MPYRRPILSTQTIPSFVQVISFSFIHGLLTAEPWCKSISDCFIRDGPSEYDFATKKTVAKGITAVTSWRIRKDVMRDENGVPVFLDNVRRAS